MKTIAGLLLGLLATGPVLAQETCGGGETLGACWSRIAGTASGLTAEVVENAKKTEQKQQADHAKQADQPGANATGSQVQSTVTDLLPWLNMLGILSDSDASDGSVVADLNFLLPGTGKADNNAQLKWELDVNPEPFEPLVAAFPEQVRQERKSTFTAELDDTADSELQFTWSLVNRHLGRDFRQHRETMNAIVEPLYAKFRGGGSVAAEQLKFMEVVEPFLETSFPERHRDKPLAATVNELTGNQGEVVRAVVAGAEASGKAQRALLDGLRPELEASGVDHLAELVLQQPQLLFGATRRLREDLVGPDSWGAKVTYEHSFANFGDFLKKARSCDPAGNEAGIQAADCYQALNKYLADHDEDLKNGSRWKLVLEYRQTDAITYSYPDDGVQLDVPKIDRLIATLGYGRMLRRSAANDRVDFEASYDSNLNDDAQSNSRFVVSLTYTRRIADLDVPFGIVYANKSEFLDGVDQQISMHVGVRFRAQE